MFKKSFILNKIARGGDENMAPQAGRMVGRVINIRLTEKFKCCFLTTEKMANIIPDQDMETLTLKNLD